MHDPTDESQDARGPGSAASSTASAEQGLELEPEQLSAAALRGLVEEFVTREGTDYGHGEWSLDEKVAQVLRQLDAGEIRIVFDLESETASLVPVGR
ncbi:MAG: YheU family protein [Spirochaetaceae bacterium]|nr:YheU family protein [Myxococcales bacterium]MCB9725906.1 YheU family protein [Spirochaetaceae bacterium]HPG26166.1 YheU family protein [Myxococcota bacterium]